VIVNWLPIKKAPKHVDLILYGTLLTYCCSDVDRGQPMNGGRKVVAVGCWRIDRWYSGLYEIIPTHWQSLPEPPS
jgi:hypothetical protein